MNLPLVPIILTSTATLVVGPIGGRPRLESLYDTEGFTSPRLLLDGDEVTIVLWLGPTPFRWALVRRKRDNARLIVEKENIKGLVHDLFDFFKMFKAFVTIDGVTYPVEPFKGFHGKRGIH